LIRAPRLRLNPRLTTALGTESLRRRCDRSIGRQGRKPV